MSLMIIALAGSLLGILCVLVGFFMEGPAVKDVSIDKVERRAKSKRRVSTLRKRAA